MSALQHPPRIASEQSVHQEGGTSEAPHEVIMDGTDDDQGTASRSSRRTRTLTRAVSVQVRYGVHSIQNMRPEMEDAHCAMVGLEGIVGNSSNATGAPATVAQSPTCKVSAVDPALAMLAGGEAPSLGSLSYFAVFDGHGGPRAAEFSSERMVELLAADRTGLLANPVAALQRAFARTEEEWLALAVADDLMDGTTAAVALVDRAANRCIVGNVGDSEVLLGTRDKAGKTGFRTLTEVHHLKRSESEAARVTAAGGRIWRGRLGHPKINPQVLSLSVTRAIGDIFFKDAKYTDGLASGLTAEPYITSVEVCARDIAEQFLLIGCDGLWDTVSYKEAADFVFTKLSEGEEPQAISEGLVHLARDAGSSDNITVMVVLLVM